MTKIQEQILELYQKNRVKFREKWKRSLPFYEELLGDNSRWERAEFLNFGQKTSIYQSSHIYGDVKVGNHTWIGPFTILDGSGGLDIGDYCSISSGVQIYTHETANWALSGGKAEYDYAPVSIGDCCFIGSHSIIRMGVKIGAHSLIGAHSFVKSDIQSYSIAAGCPAKTIGRVEVEGDLVKKYYFSGSRR